MKYTENFVSRCRKIFCLGCAKLSDDDDALPATWHCPCCEGKQYGTIPPELDEENEANEQPQKKKARKK